MVSTQCLGVRFATLMRFLPLLMLLYVAGTADGLTERGIRRSCGGRESASLYHRAKYLQLVVLGLGGLTLLVWPGACGVGVVCGSDRRGDGWLGAPAMGFLQNALVVASYERSE